MNRFEHMNYFSSIARFLSNSFRETVTLKPLTYNIPGFPLPVLKRGTYTPEQRARKKLMHQRRQKRIRTRGFA